MVKCFLDYCKHHEDEVDILFQMLSIFTIRTTIDYSFLKDFYLHTVAEVQSLLKILLIVAERPHIGVYRGSKEGSFESFHHFLYRSFLQQ